MTAPEKGPDNWMHFARNQALEIICGVMMLIGIIFSFFCCLLGSIGGALVGLSIGLFFSKILHDFVLQVRKGFATSGMFTMMMLLGTLLYFLIVATTFVIAVVVGIVIMTLINLKNNRDPEI
jgi:hypothetical protein